MPELSDEQKAHSVARFRRMVKYRLWFGWVFTIVGASLFVVGVKEGNHPMLLLNGVLFFGYGLFMVRQARRAIKNLS
jgi:hypothetical protein